MPLSFGILIGLFFLVPGAAVYLGTSKRKIALLLIAIGSSITLLTVATIFLAVNSGM